ncbi:MAG TPA: HIT domain-containing protein [Candidatus Acidoferrales bacterium]|jgi:histidine triad (HIT) family protein|nr:HIT domain-containing protein [Candidatus Acidoferrales bacterium]
MAAADRRARDPDCLFCRIVAGEIPSTAVAQSGDLLAIRDISPRAPTHVLILSREHIPSAADLGAGDGPLLGAIFELAASIAAAEGIAEAGYRVVTNVGAWGGQTVPHLHFHLLGGRSMSWPPG